MIRWNEKLKLSFELDILTPLNVWLLHYLNRTGKPWDLPGVGKGEFSRVCLKRVLERKYKAVADCTLPSWVNTANIFLLYCCCVVLFPRLIFEVDHKKQHYATLCKDPSGNISFILISGIVLSCWTKWCTFIQLVFLEKLRASVEKVYSSRSILSWTLFAITDTWW